MHRVPEQIDEYILAAYLSGELPTRLRKEIAAYLTDNARAREVLGMATDALEAIALETVAQENLESGDGAPPHLRVAPDRAEGGGESSRSAARRSSASGNQSRLGSGSLWSIDPAVPSVDHPDERRADNARFLRRIVGLVCAAVLVLAITLALHLALTLKDVTPGSVEPVGTDWEPVVDVDRLAVSWPAVESAVSYDILVYNPVSEFVIDSHQTSETTFNEFGNTLTHDAAAAGGTLQIWIEAFDTSGEFLQTSKRVSISFK